MATRRLTFADWYKLVKRHALDDQWAHIAGFPAADVATRLGVSRQRVSQLILDGVLDVIEISTKRGGVALSFVTEASLERYLAKRVPDRNRQGYFAFPTTT